MTEKYSRFPMRIIQFLKRRLVFVSLCLALMQAVFLVGITHNTHINNSAIGFKFGLIS